jgi:hypothetical protein
MNKSRHATLYTQIIFSRKKFLVKLTLLINRNELTICLVFNDLGRKSFLFGEQTIVVLVENHFMCYISVSSFLVFYKPPLMLV